ncbi:MAG: hypothetical protein FJ291_14015 [Planctomycetes bacterium]|nr:hypothetical protein [Planctomycetota bacterium]
MASTATTNEFVAEYLEHLEELYANVREWMADQPGVEFSEGRTRLNEEYGGRYTAKVLKVKLNGGKGLTFVPKGAYFIGARGHVDVSGRVWCETLVWVDKDGPAIGYKETAEGHAEVLQGRPMYPGVPRGWAWVDDWHGCLVHLNRKTFLHKLLKALTE